MKYKVVEDDIVFDDYSDAVEHCIDYYYHDENDDYFEEWINENYEGTDIGGHWYSPYTILSDAGDLDNFVDAYREDQNDYDRENALSECHNADPGDEIYVQGNTILVIEDEEEKETGDFDGDYLELTRTFYNEQSLLLKQKEEKEKKEEDDVMKLFQVIG